jgi:hypothetical protein
MKKILLISLAALLSNPLLAQKVKKNNKNKSVPVVVEEPNKEELNRRISISEQSRLTLNHQIFLEWVGHWQDEIKVWTNPGSEPSINMVEKENKIMAEGRFLVSTLFGSYNRAPYEAQSVMGYDNIKKVYVKTWFDNLGTSILVLEGVYNEKERLIDFRGETLDPHTKIPVKIHQILRFFDPANQLLEVYIAVKEGKEVKTMEVRSVRR